MVILVILAIVCHIIGMVGSVVPGIPGPPFSWLGLLLAYIAGGTVSTAALVLWFVVMVVVTIADYILPGYMAKVSGGHKAASVGAIVGLFVGMFLTPVGMLLGSFLGAFLCEYFFENPDFVASLKAALGAFLGFLVSTGIKLIVCALMLIKTTSALL